MKIKKNGKIINLTESDLKRIVKRLLTEDQQWAAVEKLTRGNIDTSFPKVSLESETSGSIPVEKIAVRADNVANILLPEGNVTAGEKINVSVIIDKSWKITGVHKEGSDTKAGQITPTGKAAVPGGGTAVRDTTAHFTITIPETEEEWKKISWYPGLVFKCENAVNAILSLYVVFPPDGKLMGGTVDKTP